MQDDPLSALDAHVGSHVFTQAIEEYLVQQCGRTVILVTHHVQYLPHAHWVSGVHLTPGVLYADKLYLWVILGSYLQ